MPATIHAGVLVVGHGTADPVGVAETRRVCDQVADLLPGVPVALGFLEVCGPSIGAAMDELAAAGCRTVIAAPILLFEAGHAKRDIPAAVHEAARARGIVVEQGDPLGCHPDIVAVSCQRRAEALARGPHVSHAETVLVMVGRGSSDPAAPSQLAAFTEATLPTGNPFRRILFGFVAATRPTLAEALHAAADPSDSGVRRILVHPHLLFRGHVEEQVHLAIDAVRAKRPDIEWVCVARLGADALVSRALVARVEARVAELRLKSSRQTVHESSQ